MPPVEYYEDTETNQPSRPANDGGMSIYEKAAMQASKDDVPNNVPEELIQQDNGYRVECRSCGRKFNETAIAKHEGICQKVFIQKRKAFDMKEQRKAEGVDEM